MSQPKLLENLYGEELYQIPSRTLVVLHKPWELTADADRAVLSKMLLAVRLSLASVQIITKKEFSVEDLAAFSPSRVLAFGSVTKSEAKPYELFSAGNTAIILADPLEMLDDAKKKSLWSALRQMFNV